MLTTTFRLAREGRACRESYRKFAKHVGGVKKHGQNVPIPLADILEVNGPEDALWCLHIVPKAEKAERDRLARLFACECAERVLYLFEARFPEDQRPREAIAVARRYLAGGASDEELAAAREAAEAAARAAAEAATREAAREAAEEAAWAATWAATWEAARAAAWAATWEAAWEAAWAATWAATWAAARAAAWAATWEAAREAARAWRAKRLRELLIEGR